MVHQPLKPPLRQILEAYPGLTPALSSTPPSYQILENTLRMSSVTLVYPLKPLDGMRCHLAGSVVWSH